MSYARFSEGDIYMFPTDDSEGECIICMGCRLPEVIDWDVKLRTKEEAIEHLDRHVRAGHSVPCRAFDRLREEIEKEQQYIEANRTVRRALERVGLDEDQLVLKMVGFLTTYNLITEFAYYCHLEDLE